MTYTHSRSFDAESVKEVRQLPVGWGQNELTRFMRAAEDNTIATFAGERKWVNLLAEIDNHLACRAPDYFHEIQPELQTSAQLFMRSFGIYRAACRLALSGQLYESTVLVRALLETGAYAWICSASPEHRAAWVDRGKGSKEKDSCRSAFGVGKITKQMRQTIGDGITNRFSALYERTIDFGAHPNVAGVNLSSATKARGDGKFELDAIYLHGWDGISLAILDVLDAISLVYALLEETIRERLQILGIDQNVRAFGYRVIGLLQTLEREIAEQQASAG